MADVSSILVNHNLDFTGFDKLAIDFENHTGSPLFITRYDIDLIYNPQLPAKFKGWLRVIYDDHELPIPVERIVVLFKHKTQDYFIIGEKRLDLAGIGIDRLYEWPSVANYISNYSNEKKRNGIWMVGADKERNYIYKQVKRFGGNECIIFNGERHVLFREMLLLGMPLVEAMKKSKYKLHLLLFSELDPQYDYIGSPNWPDTILYDDFKDLKLNEK